MEPGFCLNVSHSILGSVTEGHEGQGKRTWKETEYQEWFNCHARYSNKTRYADFKQFKYIFIYFAFIQTSLTSVCLAGKLKGNL